MAFPPSFHSYRSGSSSVSNQPYLVVHGTIGEGIATMVVPLLITPLLSHDLVGLIEHGQLQLDLLVVFLTDVHHLRPLPQHLVQAILPFGRLALTHYLLDVSE
jgi:hypothetical protein